MRIIEGTQILECPDCDTNVAAEVLKHIDVSEPDWSLRSRYSFLACPRCQHPFVMAQDDIGEGWDTPILLFPERVGGLGSSVPEPIRRAFAEALICFSAKAFTASAIMCRKSIEGLCHDQEASGRTVVAKLADLQAKGVVEARLHAWADALRMSGNQAAHDVEVSTSRADAADLIDFARALHEYVYTFGERLKHFQARQAKSRTNDVSGSA